MHMHVHLSHTYTHTHTHTLSLSLSETLFLLLQPFSLQSQRLCGWIIVSVLFSICALASDLFIKKLLVRNQKEEEKKSFHCE